MTEITDRITPEMSEEEVLGIILDEIMARSEPEVAEAIRFCAIPHWFNEEIIAWLRGEGLKPSQRNREILAALTELTFVGPYYERGWAYHENVRDLLLRRWQERDSEEFRELSGRAAEYFAYKLRGKEALLTRLFASVWRVLGKVEELTKDKCEEHRREQMYHLLVADEKQGLEQLGDMFTLARNLHNLSTCALLLQLVAEQTDYLSPDSRRWVKYFEGELAYYSTQWTKARRLFEELIGQRLPRSLELAVTHLLGMVYRVKGEWERAIDYYKRNLAILEQEGDEQRMATTYNNLGVVYGAKRKWDQAIEFYERSLAILKKMDDVHGMATTFNNLGEVYRHKGEWEQATKYHERSLEIYEETGNEYGIAVAFDNLGLVCQDKREWEQAIEYHERSLAILAKVCDVHGMATTYNNLGSVYQARGQWEQAIEFYERSLAILKKAGDAHGIATTCNNMGSVYQAKGEWKKAIEYYRLFLKIAGRMDDIDLVGTTLSNLGKKCQEKGEWGLAMECYASSLRSWQKVGDERKVAFSCNDIAMLWLEQGRLREAIGSLERSVEILERIGDKPSADTVRENLEKVKRELEAKTGQA
jgi:tetratricopeptide (TPR) repeat protein